MPAIQADYTPVVIADTTNLSEEEWLEYRRTGIGRQAVKELFDKFKGSWQLKYHPKNTASVKFWNAVVGEYTGGKYEQIKSCPGTEYADGTPGDILIFKT